MTSGRDIDVDTWSGVDQFRFFRTYERPHYAITARIDVSGLMAADPRPPIFRTCLWAIGAGLHAVPELRMRFSGDRVTLFDRIDLSSTVPTGDGDFRFSYIPWTPDRVEFENEAAKRLAEIGEDQPHNANTGEIQAIAYLSCLPWMDYTALDNAMPHAADCIPRVSWGRIVPSAAGNDMAMTIQVHHALVHGFHLGQFFSATQNAFNSLTT